MVPTDGGDGPPREGSLSRQCGSPVAVVATADGDTTALLDAALDALDFATLWPAPGAGSRALILLDLGAFEIDSPVLPDRTLVERLIDRLAALGWSEIAIASTADSSSTWAENREVFVLADLFGYRYETSTGTPYDIVDLSENLVDAGFPPGSALAGSPLSTDWTEADLRVVVAKACTDQRDGIVLAANTLLCALPLHDKDMAYRLAMNAADAASLLQDRAPPHLTLIDLRGIAHGSGGRTLPQRADSRALVAAYDLLAADAAAAAKMGTDPAMSPLWADLAARRGLPVLDLVRGDLAPLPGVRLPESAIVDSTRARDRSALFGRLVAPWIQAIDQTLFAFRHPLDAKMHDALAARLAHPDDDPIARAALVLINRLCTAIASGLDAWRVNYDKDLVSLHRAGVSPETLACPDADYCLMEQEIDGLETWLADSGAGEPPLRWRKLNRAVVFSVAHDYPVPFDAFTSRVDISRTIQLMNDYIGGTILVQERDDRGRPLRQVERNLYLPQPNYLAWWGGKNIDVSKIESVHYDTGRNRMYWKTIQSENASATYDDGRVTFEAVDRASTRVSVLGRQLFTLPPIVEAARLDLHPALESHLVAHAYTTFFSRTFANFEALLDSRQIAIGAPLPGLGSPTQLSPRPIDAMADTAARLAELLGPLLQGLVTAPPPASSRDSAKPAGLIDADGFAHFQPTPPTPAAEATPEHDPLPLRWWEGLAAGYAEAVRRDIAAGPSQGDGSPLGAECRGSMHACAGMDGTKGSRVSRLRALQGQRGRSPSMGALDIAAGPSDAQIRKMPI